MPINYGVKVTKLGYDIATADLSEQIFNSQKNCLKISTSGTSSSTASGARTISIAHGLSVTPTFLILSEYNNNGDWYFGYVYKTTWSVVPYSTGTYLKIVISTSTNKKVEVAYYIFVDPGD